MLRKILFLSAVCVLALGLSSCDVSKKIRDNQTEVTQLKEEVRRLKESVRKYEISVKSLQRQVDALKRGTRKKR